MNHYRIDSSYDGHAVTSLASGETYTYDENGNMIERLEGGQIYYQTFDAENRLVSVTVGGQTTQFVYDGDGNLVKKIKPDGSRTIYIGNVYEVDKNSGGAVTRTVTHYPAGGAMRIDGNVYYVLKDRLGSAYATTDASGNVVGEMRYYAFGETRLSTGTMFTDRLFTGQRQIAELGIYHYNARFYSPTLGRFLSADSIMSGMANPQNLNRFSYVANNPLRYTDPTGHMMSVGDDGGCFNCSYTPPPDEPEPDNGDNDDNDNDDGGGGSVLPMPSPTDPECTTVLCRALEGDLGAIVDLLVPTTWGWRIQGEGSFDLAVVVPNFSISLSGGANIVYNRYSDQLAMNVDWAIEPGFGIGAGGSVTTGPLVGWGSSSVEDVTTGTSGLISGTAAYIAAISAGVTSPWPLRDDPVYGFAPATVYVGAGAGGDYAGVGAGPSNSIISIDLSMLLPSHWDE